MKKWATTGAAGVAAIAALLFWLSRDDSSAPASQAKVSPVSSTGSVEDDRGDEGTLVRRGPTTPLARPMLPPSAAVRINQKPGALAKGRMELAARLDRMLALIPTDEERAAFLMLLYDNQQELIGIQKAVEEGPLGDWVHWEPQAWNEVVMKFEPKVRKLLGNATARKMYFVWPLSTLVYQASLTELLVRDSDS